ncbi:class I SAM-dependent DNA methyltransferase [Rhizobium sp. C4]|uniref:class I SAM-dependent DNA methyltransferase n=1 Tax=Rhizobium sp. C4 TaxID=1349800 RepID=UPI001E37A9F9|nr:class I SAM-dependent methyltransferase [Rhizobium sp. C4]MCD2171401.1 class I SAM-dependent methyltransferase [Rhizobium sp. C4]
MDELDRNEDRLFNDAFLATVYDAWYPSKERDDYAFYLPFALAARRVLDVGCGTGTFLSTVLGRGHTGHLTGIDPSAGVIEVARRHAGIAWIEGRLEDQTWSETFDLAVMTGHAFQTIRGHSDMKRFLGSAARSLRAGGLFAFESRNPTARAWESWRDRPSTAIQMPDGREVTVSTRLTSDFNGETVSFVHTFTGDFAGSPLQSEGTLQFWSEPVLSDLLQQAGFVIEAQYGDFAGVEFDQSSAEIVIIARKI